VAHVPPRLEGGGHVDADVHLLAGRQGLGERHRHGAGGAEVVAADVAEERAVLGPRVGSRVAEAPDLGDGGARRDLGAVEECYVPNVARVHAGGAADADLVPHDLALAEGAGVLPRLLVLLPRPRGAGAAGPELGAAAAGGRGARDAVGPKAAAAEAAGGAARGRAAAEAGRAEAAEAAAVEAAHAAQPAAVAGVVDAHKVLGRPLPTLSLAGRAHVEVVAGDCFVAGPNDGAHAAAVAGDAVVDGGRGGGAVGRRGGGAVGRRGGGRWKSRGGRRAARVGGGTAGRAGGVGSGGSGGHDAASGRGRGRGLADDLLEGRDEQRPPRGGLEGLQDPGDTRCHVALLEHAGRLGAVARDDGQPGSEEPREGVLDGGRGGSGLLATGRGAGGRLVLEVLDLGLDLGLALLLECLGDLGGLCLLQLLLEGLEELLLDLVILGLGLGREGVLHSVGGDDGGRDARSVGLGGDILVHSEADDFELLAGHLEDVAVAGKGNLVAVLILVLDGSIAGLEAVELADLVLELGKGDALVLADPPAAEVAVVEDLENGGGLHVRHVATRSW